MTDLVPADALPVPSPDAERWRADLDLAGRWLAEFKGNTRSTYADAIGYPFHPTTGAGRTGILRNGVALLPWLAAVGVHLLDLNRAGVVAWAEDLRETPHPDTGELLSHSTRAHCFTIAVSLYRWLIETGHTESNPLLLVNRKNLGVDLPKSDSPTRSLTRDEVAQLQHAADHDPVASVQLRSSALVAMLYRLGMRVSELCNADTRHLERTGGHRILWITLKGDRPHPYKIPTEVGARLDRYLASRGIGGAVAIRGQSGGAVPLFTTSTGERMRRTDVADLLKRLAEQADIEDPGSVSPHTARHSLITALRQAGVPDDKIRRFVGHLYSSTTDRYGHHVLDLENSPADLIDDLFEQALTDLNPPIGDHP